jgi:hypothetical protein
MGRNGLFEIFADWDFLDFVFFFFFGAWVGRDLNGNHPKITSRTMLTHFLGRSTGGHIEAPLFHF